jgi:hypothetical protein
VAPVDEDNFEQVFNFYLGAKAAGLYNETTGVAGGAGLPTSDPHVVGVLWNNAGVLHVSAG